jgi:protein-ribulosamine 3-kinase
MSLWPAIAEHISATTGTPFKPKSPRTVGGGCINATYVLDDGERSFFVKTNSADKAAMFAAEAAGLAEIAHAKAIRVPLPVCHGTSGAYTYIVLEYIALGAGKGQTALRLGEQLAALHRTRAAQFGWKMDNTIGATPQPNPWMNDWIDFWGEQRLVFQLQLAARKGLRGAVQGKGERLVEALPHFFAGYRPQPSLLHGDLWGGNWGADGAGDPVIFDPAVYYGDREADIAMTELFGGFPAGFHDAYADAYPLDPGYETRKILYNLYHILNHFNLFGGGYGSQAEHMIDRLLADIR